MSQDISDHRSNIFAYEIYRDKNTLFSINSPIASQGHYIQSKLQFYKCSFRMFAFIYILLFSCILHAVARQSANIYCCLYAWTDLSHIDYLNRDLTFSFLFAHDTLKIFARS